MELTAYYQYLALVSVLLCMMFTLFYLANFDMKNCRLPTTIVMMLL